jgi:putative ABC transport system substrate-binding protein
MRRREFIALGAIAAATWATMALPQQAGGTRRVGFLMSIPNNDEGQARISAFREALRQTGWMEDDNVRLDQRWGAGNDLRIRVYAGELVALNPDVIVVNDPRSLAAVQAITRTVPIVFIATADPVGLGLVKSMERPGGNVTGFTTFDDSIIGKSIESLLEAAPRVKRVLVLSNPDAASASRFRRLLDAAVPGSGVRKLATDIRTASEAENAVAKFAAEPDGGLVILPDGTTVAQRELIVSLANKYRLPAISGFRSFVAAGGLMSYGVDLPALYGRAATYVDRIFRGTRAGDLPVQAPNKFELLVNLKAASTLGIEFPPTLLARADEVVK